MHYIGISLLYTNLSDDRDLYLTYHRLNEGMNKSTTIVFEKNEYDTKLAFNGIYVI